MAVISLFEAWLVGHAQDMASADEGGLGDENLLLYITKPAEEAYYDASTTTCL